MDGTQGITKSNKQNKRIKIETKSFQQGWKGTDHDDITECYHIYPKICNSRHLNHKFTCLGQNHSTGKYICPHKFLWLSLASVHLFHSSNVTEYVFPSGHHTGWQEQIKFTGTTERAQTHASSMRAINMNRAQNEVSHWCSWRPKALFAGGEKGEENCSAENCLWHKLEQWIVLTPHLNRYWLV